MTQFAPITAYMAATIARLCHAANRAICIANGDDSQVSWDKAEIWQSDSAIRGVEFVVANPDAGPEALHEAWVKDKLADGWTHGPVKDAAAKTHPCLVPFTELPFEQRVTDSVFRAIVTEVLAMSGAQDLGRTSAGTRRVLCTNPNLDASQPVNGVMFYADRGQFVSEPLSAEVAEGFAGIPGYTVVGAPAAEDEPKALADEPDQDDPHGDGDDTAAKTAPTEQPTVPPAPATAQDGEPKQPAPAEVIAADTATAGKPAGKGKAPKPATAAPAVA